MIRAWWMAATAGLAMLLTALPAAAGVFLLTSAQGIKLSLPEFGTTIPFTATLLSGDGSHFGATFSGLIYADPRYCGTFPPGAEPQDCREPIDPVFGFGAFDATADGAPQSLFLPFYGSTGVDGLLEFTATDGGLIRIDIDAQPVTAVPEPVTWLTMVGGLAAVGAALRRRRRPALAA